MDFNQWLMAHEAPVRLGFFIGILVLMMLWERLAPRRQPLQGRLLHWGNNLALVSLNSVILRLIFPAAAVGLAAYAADQGWGLFNQLDWAPWLEWLLAVVVLDLVIYLQHVMVHAVPLLWRLHRVHHADLDYDTTTGLRFHPFEILLSMLIKFAAIATFGPAVVAVVIFEVVLNGMSMFNHGNVRLPLGLDRLLRSLLVTPDMHRVHHSIDSDEANSNFGFNLSIWDRLLGTYRAQPRAGHEGMTIGITTFRDARLCTWLPGLLRIPFIGNADGYPINRRWEKSDE